MKNSLKIATPTDREILISRTFDAPRELVWEAMSKPEFIKRWLFTPAGWTLTGCEEDRRVGGRFRWAWSGPDGGVAMSMTGLYREIVPPERVVRTETFEFGCVPQAGEQLATLVLSERGEKTLLALTVLYPSREARDATIASGMERGLGAGYDKLDEMLMGVGV